MIEQIPNGILVATGTIGASVIAGSIGFLSLIISKEQKVSEFRQEWIDELREDLSSFLSCAASISLHAQNYSAKKSKGVEFTREEVMSSMEIYLASASELYYRILLRLNPSEHEELREHVDRLKESLSDENILSQPEESESLCTAISKEAHKVLKKEWNTVKSGEVVYRTIKIISAVSLGVAIVFSVGVLLI